MISSLSVKGFTAIPYLEATLLMKTQKKTVQFSTQKPNVIVGPNGAGKSALLQTLALRSLTFFMSESTFDDNYVVGHTADSFWSNERGWRNDYEYLPGLTCKSDNAPAMYYRPGHIPGNDDSITAAMICGYFEEAKSYGNLVDNKSSGQQSSALLQKLLMALSGEVSDLRFRYTHWRAGKERKDLTQARFHTSDFEYKAEILKKLFDTPPDDALPLILMDEPEQSLDARAEAVLWGHIAKADCSKVQVIVATHSLYPLMHPELFNLIEAVPGYVDEVRALL